MPLRIAVDFDNTLFVGDYPEVDQLVPGALSYMRRLAQEGHRLTIWSSRASTTFGDPIQRAEGLQKMRDALVAAGVPFHAIDYGGQGKIAADVYVDDRGLGAPLRDFQGVQVVDWPAAYNLVRLVEISRRLR